MANQPTKKQRERWEAIRALGCIVESEYAEIRCCSAAEIHHIETGSGGRKDHDRVIPLCNHHHRGSMGIHSVGRKIWVKIFGTEQELFEKVCALLGEEARQALTKKPMLPRKY